MSVLNGVNSAYFIQIDGKMINPKTLLRDLEDIEAIIIEIYTKEMTSSPTVEPISFSVAIQDNPEEDYLVNKNLALKDISTCILGMNDLDPELYQPTIDGEVIDLSTVLKSIPDLSSVIIEFQRTNVNTIEKKTAVIKNQPENKQLQPEEHKELKGEHNVTVQSKPSLTIGYRQKYSSYLSNKIPPKKILGTLLKSLRIFQPKNS